MPIRPPSYSFLTDSDMMINKPKLIFGIVDEINRTVRGYYEIKYIKYPKRIIFHTLMQGEIGN